jgi:5-methylcytosine-specific restriction endonuclease McrA
MKLHIVVWVTVLEKQVCDLACCVVALPESGEDPEVTRAKYFIRDEFLVSECLRVR